MTDIVTRLHRHNHDWLPTVHTPCDYCDAADEIERLRAAGDALADWAEHEHSQSCKSNWKLELACTCGLTKVAKGWEEACRG